MFHARMAEGRAYKCCCPIFMLNLLDSPTPQVPICNRQLADYTSHFFSTAPDLDDMPEFHVSAPKNLDIDKAWGMLRQVSPLEVTMPMLTGCARALDSVKDLNVL